MMSNNLKNKSYLTLNSIQLVKSNFKYLNILNYPRYFEIDLPEFTKKQNLHFTNEIKKLSEECGCDTGKIFSGAFVFFYTSFVILHLWNTSLEYKILNCILFAIIGAFIGKIYGLLKANYKIKKLIREIETSIYK